MVIGALVNAFTAAGQAGCKFHISHPHGMVRKLLDITGVLEPLTESSK
jgi:anti-anti-sigma regulatory factor